MNTTAAAPISINSYMFAGQLAKHDVIDRKGCAFYVASRPTVCPIDDEYVIVELFDIEAYMTWPANEPLSPLLRPVRLHSRLNVQLVDDPNESIED